VVIAALAFGVAAGTYGIADAASGSGSGSGQAPAAAAPNDQRSWGPQRSDETPLTGDALSKVTAAAKAKVPGGTIIRVETDADGDAAYEAHMVKADGTPVTVYVNKQFDVVSVESGMPGRPGRAPAQSSSGASA
jgi:Peptidase propeptide and YPEB domain